MLSETVKSLCTAVVTLKNRMEIVNQSNANLGNPTESEALRLTIRKEVKDMEKRERERGSLR